MLIIKTNRIILSALLAIAYMGCMACEKIDILLDDNVGESQLIEDASQTGQNEEIIVFDSDSLKVTIFKELSGWNNMQGGAIYGDKLVCLMATDEMVNESCNGFIYNIVTGEKESELLFTSEINNRIFSKPHANQVSFGNQVYDSNSDFPLLYVSQVNGGTGYHDISGERGVLVYDLKRNQYGGYNPVLVQVIIPDLEDKELIGKLGAYTPNYVVDLITNQIVVIGYPHDSWFDLRGPQPIVTFNIPSLNAGNVVVLSNDDVVDSYDLPFSLGLQQSFIHGRKIFSTGGWAKHGTLRIINLDNKTTERVFQLTDFTFGEPQFFGVWKGHFLYYEAGTKGSILEFVFTQE